MHRHQNYIILSVPLLIAAFTLLPSSARSAQWLFKPVARDATSDYSKTDLEDGEWQVVALPHREWDTIQTQDSVYGWYRCHISVPPEYSGFDLVLKLGIVDDTDWTFVNGIMIGTTAAYNAERVYVIPAKLLKPGSDNVIAVKVYDIVGTGGLLCEPRLGLRLAPSNEWLFAPGDAEQPDSRASADLDDEGWQRIPLPDEEWDKRQPANNVYGWYRLHFRLPQALPSGPVILDLGIVNDVDQTLLNGQLVGATGGFPPTFASAAGEPRLYPLPDGALKLGANNVLALRVFNGEAKGGIQGEPTLLIPYSEAMADGGISPAQAWLLYRRGDYEDACAAAHRGLSSAKTPAERAAFLSVVVAAMERQGRPQDALKWSAKLIGECPKEIWARETLDALARIQQDMGGQLAAPAAYLGQDRSTRGDWWLMYGTDAFMLLAAMGDADLVGAPGHCRVASQMDELPLADRLFDYRLSRCTAKDSHHYNWMWAWQTEDRRALVNPVTGTRTAACADDKGEEHPFDDEGPDLQMTLEVPQGWWRLSAYLVDYDWYSTWHPRQHSLILHDALGQPLAVANTGKFGTGVWERFAVCGPRKVTLRVCKRTSLNTVLSAVCIDRISGPVASLFTAADDQLLQVARTYQALCAPPNSPVALALRASELLTTVNELAAKRSLTGDDLCLLEWMRWQLQIVRDSHSAPDVSAIGVGFVDAVKKLPARDHDAIMAQHAAILADHHRLSSAAYLLKHISNEGWTRLAVSDPKQFARLFAEWQTLDYPSAKDALIAAIGGIGELQTDVRNTTLVSIAGSLRHQPVLVANGATLSADHWPSDLPLPRVKPSLACLLYDAVSRLPREALQSKEISLAAWMDIVNTLLDAAPLSNWVQPKEYLSHKIMAMRLARSIGDAELTGRVVADVSRNVLALRDQDAAMELLQETRGAALQLQAILCLAAIARELDLPSGAASALDDSMVQQGMFTPAQRVDLAVVVAGEMVRRGEGAAARQALMAGWHTVLTEVDTPIPLPAVLRIVRALSGILIRDRDGLAIRDLLDQLAAMERHRKGEQLRAIKEEVNAIRLRASMAGLM